MALDSETTYYVIDGYGNIAETGGAWDRFAEQNGGDSLLGDRTVGYALSSFIDGIDTMASLNAIFFSARRYGNLFDTLYRCDAPHERRLFRMTVVPMKCGELRLEHRLISANPRTPLHVPLPPALEQVTACSMCCSAFIDRHWVEQPSLPSRSQGAISRQVVCPTCREQLQQDIASSQRRGLAGKASVAMLR